MNQKLVAAVLAASVALAAGCIQPDRTGPNKGAQPVIKGETFYLCGHTPVAFSAPAGRARMNVAGESFELKPAVSASGARYTAVDDTAAGFWNKGERAVVTVRGRELPECRTLREPELPFTARGQEPGWMITIDADAILLDADYGALKLRMPKTEPLMTDEGFLYRTESEGRRLAEITLSYAGEIGQFAGAFPIPGPGPHDITVYAFDPRNGNIGVDRTTIVVAAVAAKTEED